MVVVDVFEELVVGGAAGFFEEIGVVVAVVFWGCWLGWAVEGVG